MKRHILPVSALVAGAALAWTALAWQPTPPPAGPLTGAENGQLAAAKAGPLPVVAVEPHVVTMTERPIFSPGRRPPEGDVEIALGDTGQPGVPRVQGVALSGGIAIVVVSDDDGRQKSVRQGDDIAGWTVETIRPDFVSFGSDGATVDVPVVIRK